MDNFKAYSMVTLKPPNELWIIVNTLLVLFLQGPQFEEPSPHLLR